jgi:hypothetical protein
VLPRDADRMRKERFDIITCTVPGTRAMRYHDMHLRSTSHALAAGLRGHDTIIVFY